MVGKRRLGDMQRFRRAQAQQLLAFAKAELDSVNFEHGPYPPEFFQKRQASFDGQRNEIYQKLQKKECYVYLS